VLSTKAAEKIWSPLNKEVSGILIQHHYTHCAIAQGNSKTLLFIIIAIIFCMPTAHPALSKAQKKMQCFPPSRLHPEIYSAGRTA